MKKSNEYAMEIADNLADKILLIENIVHDYYLDELLSNLKNLSSDEKEQVLEDLINNYLQKINDLNNKPELKTISDEVYDTSDYFKFSKDKPANEKVEKYGDIMEEADTIAFQLYSKIIGTNDRKISLPIKVEYIKEYCISPSIGNEKLEKTLVWLALDLSIIYNCLVKK
ncbi:MAG: hypothetical protein Q4F88_07155 [Eubacteriales bacterium]|nr:hypothetical protein [Eubacteriales bacterium]